MCDYSKITKEKIEEIIKSINPEYTIEYPSPYGQLMLVAYVKKLDVIGNDWWKEKE